ncbi:DUF6428 family protein [Labrys okinawensis]|uniref:DUF6428 family protein n=1 Tax=Labrys okinawensis TaxID=346911 RepID=UPI0039BD03D5
MNASASPLLVDFHGDASLGAILSALGPHAAKALIIRYGDRTIRPGYHVTEVKAGSFVTLDCGGNPDAWQETILQVEDLGPEGERSFMHVGKFTGILNQVGTRVRLDPDARLTFEVGPPGVPMQVFDVDTLQIRAEQVELRLGARAAICKPRHRAEQQEKVSQCCAPTASKGSTCCT